MKIDVQKVTIKWNYEHCFKIIKMSIIPFKIKQKITLKLNIQRKH